MVTEKRHCARLSFVQTCVMEKGATPPAEVRNDEDDDDEDDETIEPGQVMLGYVFEPGEDEEGKGDEYPPIFTTTDWMSWDGGKVGGKPIWLNRKDLPSIETIECGICGELMKFVLQIYCPVDGIGTAFHRAMYVVCCHKKSCIENHSLQTRSVKVLRCQLARENEFYPYESSEDGACVEDLPVWSTFPKLCQVCGFKATKVCSRCNNANYCCKAHQKIDFRVHKHVCRCRESVQDQEKSESDQLADSVDTNVGSNIFNKLNFPEYEIYVEPEMVFKDIAGTEKKSGDFQDLVCDWEEAATTQEDGAIIDNDDDDDDDDDDNRDDKNIYSKKDKELTQKDYSEALGNKAPDPLYRKFLNRIRVGGPKQILRYCQFFHFDVTFVQY